MSYFCSYQIITTNTSFRKLSSSGSSQPYSIYTLNTKFDADKPKEIHIPAMGYGLDLISKHK